MLHWWTPLGLRCITRSRVLISARPMFYEYLFTVNADTIAEVYSLNHIILHESCLIDSGRHWVCCSILHDKRCFGALCLCTLTHKSPFSYPTRSFSTIPTTTLTPSIWRTCYIESVKIGTLLLKYFPMYKTQFIWVAHAETVAPDDWKILLSQWHRWINLMIHILGNLMFLDQLCSFCGFSMWFIVMVDLVLMLIEPVTAAYVW